MNAQSVFFYLLTSFISYEQWEEIVQGLPLHTAHGRVGLSAEACMVLISVQFSPQGYIS